MRWRSAGNHVAGWNEAERNTLQATAARQPFLDFVFSRIDNDISATKVSGNRGSMFNQSSRFIVVVGNRRRIKRKIPVPGDASFRGPNQNHLLAALPTADFERVAAHLEPVPMLLG